MKLFNRKEKIILRSEQQKDDFIEKLDRSNINYDIREEKKCVSDNNPIYIIRINADDMKKVV
ncbi:MAG: hypothetical protein K6B28_05620 [Lachnospiraceae bacterium]|nr:hypothetical protein [Lachnospiraceae bacterium]